MPASRNALALWGRGANGFDTFFWDGRVDFRDSKKLSQFGSRHPSDDAVPTANPKPLTPIANRLILAPDERSSRIDLVRFDRAVQVAGCVGSSMTTETPTIRANAIPALTAARTAARYR